MPILTPARARLALLALALGGFGIGTTEFVAMGLLPDIARDLLPALYAANPEDALASAGWMVSIYALGVVVGAPTIATVAARFPRKKLLLVLVAGFTLATAASALLPTFGGILAARFIAGLGHGAYFGVAALVAASLLGEGKRARGVALVLSGLTISNVIGVPLITILGQSAGWRVAYLVVAAIFAATFVAIALALPDQPGDRTATIARELTAFRRPQVWFALLFGSIGFGGFFAVYTYVAPLVTEVTGLPTSAISIALVAIGLGMTLGNFIGGRAADHHVMGTILILFGVFAVSLAGLALSASNPVGLFAFLFLVGASASAISPAIQTRLMDVAGDAQTLAAALNHAALNAGNSLGAIVGGLAISAGFGFVAPTWAGLALAIVGLLLAIASAQLGRRAMRRRAAENESEASGTVVVGLEQDAVLDGALS